MKAELAQAVATPNAMLDQQLLREKCATGDGYILMSKLRDNFGLKGIALTGYGMEPNVLRGQNTGFGRTSY